MRITAPFVSNHRNYLRIFLNSFLDAAAIVGNLLLLESHWVFCFHLFLPRVEKLQLLRVQCVEDENASPVSRMRMRAVGSRDYDWHSLQLCCSATITSATRRAQNDGGLRVSESRNIGVTVYCESRGDTELLRHVAVTRLQCAVSTRAPRPGDRRVAARTAVCSTQSRRSALQRRVEPEPAEVL